MESPHKKVLVFKNQSLDLPEVAGGDAAIVSETYRFQPELALAIRCANVNMRRLARFIRVKVKTIGSYAQHRRHNRVLGSGCVAFFQLYRIGRG
jgi:hypothetical protein